MNARVALASLRRHAGVLDKSEPSKSEKLNKEGKKEIGRDLLS